MKLCFHVFIYLYMYLCEYVCSYFFMYVVRMYVCMCVCVCMYEAPTWILEARESGWGRSRARESG